MKNEEYKRRITQMHVMPEGQDLFSKEAYSVEINDHGGGEYVIVTDMAEGGEIAIDLYSWDALKHTIEEMIMQCRKGKE